MDKLPDTDSDIEGDLVRYWKLMTLIRIGIELVTLDRVVIFCLNPFTTDTVKALHFAILV